MKKFLFAAVLLFAALEVSAQEPKRLDFSKADSIASSSGLVLPDSMAYLTPWKPEYQGLTRFQAKPAISMTSVVVLKRDNLPARVTVIDNNSLRMGSHFNVSNGQAWNNGPYLNSFLDARTLSFPGRR